VYALDIKTSARRTLVRLGESDFRRVDEAIQRLAVMPRPPGCLKLKGWKPPAWRIRVGDFRVIYTVDDGERLVTVMTVSHRSHAY
jgi:mRNA interferase RelE/StbE